jgi:hypothetical protein
MEGNDGINVIILFPHSHSGYRLVNIPQLPKHRLPTQGQRNMPLRAGAGGDDQRTRSLQSSEILNVSQVPGPASSLLKRSECDECAVIPAQSATGPAFFSQSILL